MTGTFSPLEEVRVSRHLFFSWPLIETEVGQALSDYEEALVRECLADESEENAARQTTLRFRTKLEAELVKLLANTPWAKAPWFEPETERLGVKP